MSVGIATYTKATLQFHSLLVFDPCIGHAWDLGTHKKPTPGGLIPYPRSLFTCFDMPLGFPTGTIRYWFSDCR
jgi:hypothetical protein